MAALAGESPSTGQQSYPSPTTIAVISGGSRFFQKKIVEYSFREVRGACLDSEPGLPVLRLLRRIRQRGRVDALSWLCASVSLHVSRSSSSLILPARSASLMHIHGKIGIRVASVVVSRWAAPACDINVRRIPDRRAWGRVSNVHEKWFLRAVSCYLLIDSFIYSLG